MLLGLRKRNRTVYKTLNQYNVGFMSFENQAFMCSFSCKHHQTITMSPSLGISWSGGAHCAGSAPKSSIRRFVITDKAPTRAFSWLKAATTAFTFKTLLRHYAKRALTPRFLNVKLGPRRNYHKGWAAIRHYAN